MGMFSANYWWRGTCDCLSSKTHLRNSHLWSGGYPFGLDDGTHILSSQLHTGFGPRITAFASRKSAKKVKRNKEKQSDAILQTSNSTLDDYGVLGDNPTSEDDKNEVNTSTIPSRSTVLQACSVTSGLIAVLGLAIRQISISKHEIRQVPSVFWAGLVYDAQGVTFVLALMIVSHVASSSGLPVFDCSQVSFGFEIWHLELITGLVVMISLSRYTLLNTWPDFAESSEAANRQVLTSLQPLDFVIVAFLPGISEELLFRGGLLPLVGLNWKGALAIGALFGVLHLGSGRKYSFAIWATFVGLAYGYAAIVSSSVVVPMASHALNNLIGALLWRLTSRSSEQIVE